MPTDRFPYLTTHVGLLIGGDGDERFAFGLDMLIAGIASMAATPQG